MKTILFDGLVLASILTLCVSCEERQNLPTGGGYKTLNVTLSDRMLHSDFPATIQGGFRDGRGQRGECGSECSHGADDSRQQRRAVQGKCGFQF